MNDKQESVLKRYRDNGWVLAGVLRAPVSEDVAGEEEADAEGPVRLVLRRDTSELGLHGDRQLDDLRLDIDVDGSAKDVGQRSAKGPHGR